VTAVVEPPETSVALLGRTTPRIWTQPLVTGRPGPCGCGCALTSDTSLGYEAVRFAEELCGITPLPWQRWWLIHALELKADKTFRFRQIVTTVARQNGKTHLLKLLTLYLLFTGRAKFILGTAQALNIARESWTGACDIADASDDLRAEVAKIRQANGEQELTLRSGARYMIAAATRSAGRGHSVDVLIMDELREQRDWAAWGALSKTTNARPNALILGISNAGDDESVVLNTLRASAIAGADPTMGIFEWSAVDGCDTDDPEAWTQANPALGITITEGVLRSALATDPPNVFRTECLCQRVEALDSAIDGASWQMCADPSGSLSSARSRIAACIDVAPDGQHVTLMGAAVLDDGRVRVEVLEAWKSTTEARQELAALLAQLKPAVVGWFPSGPAAELGVELRALGAVEVKGSEVAEACQEFAGLVESRKILHPADELLDAHVANSSKLRNADGWRFARRGAGHVDATYACAGAVRIARTLPPPTKRVRSRIY
jgi:hypothetical protein